MSQDISGIALSIKRHPNKYGIKQSLWNDVSMKVIFGGFKDERSLVEMIKRETISTCMRNSFQTKPNFWGTPKYVKTGEYMDSEWRFSSIGSFNIREGFLSNEPYILCANCHKGKVFGKFVADTAEIMVVKESANPSRPSRSDILEKNYSLWSISLDLKCDKCNNHTQWSSIQRDGRSWGCVEYNNIFSKIG